MSQTYLNGKLTISSLAAPTAADIEAMSIMSDQERSAILGEALERGRKSPVGERTVDEIWDRSLARATAIKAKRANAL